MNSKLASGSDQLKQSDNPEIQLSGVELIKSIIELSDKNGGFFHQNRQGICEFLKRESSDHPDLTHKILDLGKQYDYQGYGSLVSHALSCLVIRGNGNNGHKKYANDMLDRLIKSGDHHIALVYSNQLGIYKEELVDFDNTKDRVWQVISK